jgi:hypothetical protein
MPSGWLLRGEPKLRVVAIRVVAERRRSLRNKSQALENKHVFAVPYTFARYDSEGVGVES